MKKQLASIQRFAAIAVACAGLFAFSMTSKTADANAALLPEKCVHCGSIGECLLFNNDWGYSGCAIDFRYHPPCEVSGGMC